MAMLRSYLIRATYSWLVEHGLTPYLLINAEQQGVQVPEDYIDDGTIVLNASPDAVTNLNFLDNEIHFEASFNGEVFEITVPNTALLAIYSQETSQGLYANEDGVGMWVDEGDEDAEVDPTPVGEKPKKASHLRVVK
jgi:stringent starvation protein B